HRYTSQEKTTLFAVGVSTPLQASNQVWLGATSFVNSARIHQARRDTCRANKDFRDGEILGPGQPSVKRFPRRRMPADRWPRWGAKGTDPVSVTYRQTLSRPARWWAKQGSNL